MDPFSYKYRSAVKLTDRQPPRQLVKAAALGLKLHAFAPFDAEIAENQARQPESPGSK
jgi:hypothetical protein